jgi:hypothetical protein
MTFTDIGNSNLLEIINKLILFILFLWHNSSNTQPTEEHNMKWVEIIKLRSAGNDPRGLDDLLLPMSELTQSGLEIRIYRHAALESDLSIHLYWDTEAPGRSGSGLGLQLAQALEEFGLVDHGIWIKAGII